MWHHSPSYSVFTVGFAALVAWRGYTKKSLSSSGAVAAWIIGTLHLLAGPQFGLTLIVFFFSSSKLTKLKEDVKAKLEDDFKSGGQRTATQVIVNSLGGSVFAAAAAMQVGGVTQLQGISPAALIGGFLGHYACCCADTWASEVGVLSQGQPRLVTTFQVVPKGTNGGVSSLGTLCGAAGSLLMGLTFWLSGLLTLLKGATMPAMPCVIIALFGGTVGNFIDSLLGATLQYSGYSRTKHCVVTAPGPGIDRICGQSLLSNSQVNLVASLVTCVMTSWFAVQIL
ncbi:hypothetical protein WJX77_012348 [Trebouxia sp. C0004]